MAVMTDDLCLAAIKLARRLQALPRGHIYGIILVKDNHGKWSLAILSKAKLEIVQSQDSN